MKRLFLFLLLAVSPIFAANSMIIYELDGVTSTNYPIIPGMWGGHAGFAKGEIANFPQVKVNGSAVTTQADITSRWSDGSVKETDLSYLIPTLTANSSVTITFQNQATCHCTRDGSGTALTQAQMQQAQYNFDAQIQLTQPFCTGSCNTKTFSARQGVIDGKYNIINAGDVSTVIEIASDGPCGTAGKCAYDMGWERDANSGNDFTTLTASITISQTTIHVADATGWTTPIDINLWQGSSASYDGVANASPRGTSQNSEHMTVTAIAYDSGSSGPATLTVTRHSNVPSGGHAYTVSGTQVVSVWPDRWKEPTSTFCPGGDANCMNTFRPRVIAAFVVGQGLVKYRLTGEISDTQRYGDLTYNALLTIGNTNPVTVWQQSKIYHIAGTRWTKSTFDPCEAAGSYAGNSAMACGAGNTITTVTANSSHVWNIQPSGVTRAIVYPKDLWTGTGTVPTPVGVDANAAYLSSSHTTYVLNYNGPSITEAVLDRSFTDVNGTAGTWSNHLSYGNFNASTNSGWTDANIQGITSTAYRNTDNVHTTGAQMGTLDNNLAGGGGGSSEDSNGPMPLWIPQLLFSMSESNDHGLRMYIKSRGNAELSTNWPFCQREGQSGSIMDYADTPGAGGGVGQAISLFNRPSMTNNILANNPPYTTDGPQSNGSRINPVMMAEASYIQYAVNDTANGYILGFNHMPHLYPLLYAITGDYFYLEQMRFWDSFTSFWLSYIGTGDGTALSAYAGRGPTGGEALIPLMINHDPAGYGTALRVTSQIFTFRAEHTAHENYCPTISGGVCQTPSLAKYYLNTLKNALAGMEGAKNYTGGYKTNGTSLQISCWNWANNAQWLKDALAQTAGLSEGLPLNAWAYADGSPAAGDNTYGVANLTAGRGVENNYNGSSTAIAAHSSGATVKLVTSPLATGSITTTTLGLTTQAISGRITVTNSSGTTPETLTLASIPSYWGNNFKVFVGLFTTSSGLYNVTTNADYGWLGVQSFSNVNSGASQVTLSGTSPWPVGHTTFSSVAQPFVADQQFTVDSTTANGITSATNDQGGIGPPGVRILIDSEYMMVCSVSNLTVTLCPLDNTSGMRNTLIEFDAHDQMRGLWSAKFQNELPSDHLGKYFGAFWVNSLTDGTNTPRLDFNPYAMSIGRFPFVAPDEHTLISTWAAANVGFDYYNRLNGKLTGWLFGGLCVNRSGLCYAQQLPAPISQALDFGVANAQTAYNYLNNAATGNLIPQTSINDPFQAKWIWAPSAAVCTISPTSLPVAISAVAYSVTLSASGCNSSTFTVSSGSLPAWASLNASTGVISGTPSGSTPTTSSFTVAYDTASQPLSIVTAAPIVITSTSPLPTGTVGVAYSQQLTATGDTGGNCTGCVWSASGLPAGLSMSSSGLITGTPTSPGTGIVVGLSVNNANTSVGPQNFILNINPASSGTGTGVGGQISVTGTITVN